MSPVVFGVAVTLWVAFGIGVVAGYGGVDEAWRSFLDADLAVKVLEVVVFLPWILGLWAWHSDWALWLRTTAVVVLVWSSLYLLYPWRSG